MEIKRQSDLEERIKSLEKRIRKTERIKNIAVGGFWSGAIGVVASLGYTLYLSTSSSLPVLFEYKKIEAAQSYTDTITDNELRVDVEENYATQLSHIEQQEEYKRQRNEWDFYDRVSDYSAYLFVTSIVVAGCSLSYSGFLRGRKREIEEECFRSRAAK